MKLQYSYLKPHPISEEFPSTAKLSDWIQTAEGTALVERFAEISIKQIESLPHPNKAQQQKTKLLLARYGENTKH